MSKHLKRCFLILVFAIFLYQIQNSIKNFIDPPIIQITSITTVDQNQNPIVYLCHFKQYSNDKGQEYGYKWKEQFLLGNLTDNNGNLTWKGKNGNLNFVQAQNTLYVGPKTNFDVEISENLTIWEKAATEPVFFPSVGTCTKIPLAGKILKIFTNTPSYLLLVDPAKDNNLRVSEIDNAQIDMDQVIWAGEQYFVKAAYELEITMYDHKIHANSLCTSYQEKRSTYGECIRNELYLKLLETYGCLPPWFLVGSNITCEETVTVGNPPYEVLKEFLDEIKRLNDGYNMNLMKKCLPPCVMMNAKLARKSFDYKKDGALIKVEQKKEVLVYTDAYAYNIFNLVVDLGMEYSCIYFFYSSLM